MDEAIIKVRDLWYKYLNGYTALRGVNINIYYNEFIAIVGANGSGKTTLIKHFNGLFKPSKGQVIVYGKDTRKASVAELSKHVGIVFQNPLNQFFEETVEKEVMFALKNFAREVDEHKVDGILEDLGIKYLKRRSPYETSLGEQKRIALASILIYEPDVIVLDEPTIGLDYKSKTKLLDILKKLYSSGKTIIIVSHDIEFLAKVPITRIIILSSGKIVFDGSPKSAFYNIPLLLSARLVPPQIPELITRLDIKTRSKPLNEEEAYRMFIELARRMLIDVYERH